MNSPSSATQKKTTPPRAWRGLEIARKFPTSTPVDTPVIVELAPPPACQVMPEPEPPESDPGPAALRGDALAKALDALK